MRHVHVAFGFHVNCYHSYRGDTLDERNARGIPVKGTWDFENAYSLEKILPEYAPDIIERVRARGAVLGMVWRYSVNLIRAERRRIKRG